MKFVFYNDTIISSKDLKPVRFLFDSTIVHKALHNNFGKGLVYKILKCPDKVFMLQDEKENLLKLYTAIQELKEYKTNKKKIADYITSIKYLKSVKFRDKKASMLSNILLHDLKSIERVKRDDPYGFVYLKEMYSNKETSMLQLKRAQKYFLSEPRPKFVKYVQTPISNDFSVETYKYYQLAYFHHFFCMYHEAAVDYSFFANEYAKMIDCIENKACIEPVNIPDTYYPEVKLWNSYVKNEKITLSMPLKKQFTTKNQKTIYKYVQTKLKSTQKQK